jgi:DNA repair exonuclease SbcCD ATPase subunit
VAAGVDTPASGAGAHADRLELKARLARAIRRRSALRRRRGAATAAGAAALFAGAVLATMDGIVAGALLAGTGLAVGALVLLSSRGGRRLEGDIAELRAAVAEADDEFRRSRERLERWVGRHDRLRAEVERAEGLLREALWARGADATGPAGEAMRAYEESCEARAATAASAARRGALEQALRNREAAEAAAAEALRRAGDARRELRGAAERCGVAPAGGADDEALAEALRRWLDGREQALREYQAAAGRYAELESLLRAGTLEDLRRDLQRHEAAASELRRQAGPAAGELDPSGEPEARCAAAEEAAQRSRREADTLAGRVRERRSRLPDVPAAEETVLAAREELERVRVLDRTLSLVAGFLGRAQERVHRDIAPRLADVVRRSLPRITGGRYVDAVVDPATLGILVCGADGRRRDARRLSHGTAEQVYLLLRLALAEHLTGPGESCPLLLDDVTVQSDARRTAAMLDLLHEASGRHQVILFTQEPAVAEWGRARLDRRRDRIEELAALPVSATAPSVTIEVTPTGRSAAPAGT